MVRLEPMSEPEFATFIEWSHRDYANEHVRAGDWSKEEALQRSKAEIAELLPQGRLTPHHSLCTIIDDRSGTRVGEVWYALREEGGLRQVWVYWIGVDERHRRHGFAAQALADVERQAERLGAVQVALHVFGDNSAARALYATSGFRESNVIMRKKLSA